MKVEFIDLKKRYKEEKSEILNCVKRVLTKGNFILNNSIVNHNIRLVYEL